MGLSIHGLKAKTSRMRKLIWNKFHFVHLPIRCLIWNITEKYFKTTKLKNRCFCFLPITTGSDGRRSHIQRALRLKTLPSHKTSRFYFYTVWGKSWTSKNMKSSVSPDRKWRPKNVVLSESFIGISWSVFWRKNRDRTQSGKPF